MEYNFKRLTIGDCCKIEKKTVKPEKEIIYTCFSLPSFDNSRKPEILRGEDIKSSKFAVDDNTILFNKLNPKFRRVWNIHSLLKYENTICSTEFLPLKVNKGINQDFLYYYISSSSFAEIMNTIRTGTSTSHQRIDWKKFLKEPIDVPDLSVQQKIGSFLKSFDDKIETNNKINRNLEEQAEQLFKKEFIDLKQLPDKWKNSNLTSIADYINGLAMQRHRPVDSENGLPVLKIKELKQGNCSIDSELCSENIDSKYIVDDGDVIFSWSATLLVDLWCGGKCGLNQHLFRVTSNKYDKWFYYSWTKYHQNRFIDIAKDKATTMGHIKRENLNQAEVLIPSKKDYERIGKILKPIYDMIISNKIENKRLATLRDTILPKLMSGKLDVSELNI